VRSSTPGRRSATSTVPAPPRRCAARSRADSSACWSRPASACERASPSPGCASSDRMRAAISGWGTALPAQRVTSADLEHRVDTSDQWIVERTGIRERRVVGDGESTASLAVEAGAAAIKHAGLTPDAIDLLIVATATTEQLIPHTGAFVNDGLGINCGSFDLDAGGAGVVYRVGRGPVELGGGRPRPRGPGGACT